MDDKLVGKVTISTSCIIHTFMWIRTGTVWIHRKQSTLSSSQTKESVKITMQNVTTNNFCTIVFFMDIHFIILFYFMEYNFVGSIFIYFTL